MSLRFVHAADLHLDSPFLRVGIGPPLPSSVHTGCSAMPPSTLTRPSSTCASDERVDALLVAGDIYDGADRSLRAQRKLRRRSESAARGRYPLVRLSR